MAEIGHGTCELFRRMEAQAVALESVVRSRDELGLVLEAIPDGIAVFDGEGRFIYANEAAGHIFRDVPPRTEDPKLTCRELEALRWTTTGRTARQVANMMGIGERTAAIHLIRAAAGRGKSRSGWIGRTLTVRVGGESVVV
jgi:DNA-binding NarL/FixJ family response regulator